MKINLIENNLAKTKPIQKLIIIVLVFDTGYVVDMMDLLVEKVFVNPTPYTDAMLAISVPEPLSARYEKLDKQNVIASYVSRFKRGGV